MLRNTDCRLFCCILGLAYNHKECFTLIGIAAYASDVLLALVFGVQGLFPSPPLPQAMHLMLPQLHSLLCNAQCSLQGPPSAGPRPGEPAVTCVTQLFCPQKYIPAFPQHSGQKEKLSSFHMQLPLMIFESHEQSKHSWASNGSGALT